MHDLILTRRELLQSMMATALTLAPTEDRWREVTTFLEGESAAGTFPGASLIASKNGKVLVAQQYGTYCSLTRRDAPLTAKVIHPLFSYSKLVSATVIVMAHQDGLVQYDTPVKTYIPEFTGGGKDTITLRHLMTHAAGIPTAQLGAVHTEEGWRAAVNTVCGLKTEWEPGSKTQYHGLTGLFVAAEAVRRVSENRTWEQLCRKLLFDPIGAKTLTFGLPDDDAPVALTPQPKELPKSLEAGFGFAGHPAGGCLGTVGDALKVLHLHLNKGVWRGKRLISEKALAEMHRVQYHAEIQKALAAGTRPVHETWGLGPLVRGEKAEIGAYDWFGFRDQTTPGVFGHAGIDTVIGVADPATGNAVFFVTTNSPATSEKTVALRNGVTNRVFSALG
jgi:CubicO group peptidase (beta-lactamase class C family)